MPPRSPTSPVMRRPTPSTPQGVMPQPQVTPPTPSVPSTPAPVVRRPVAPLTRAEAARRIAIYAAENRLTQQEAWHVIRDGKNLASIVGAIDMKINGPDDVPDAIMPSWLVTLVTALADGVPADALHDHAIRFATALDTLLPTQDLLPIRERFLTHLPHAYVPPDDEHEVIGRLVAGLWEQATVAHTAAAAPPTDPAQAAQAACEAVAWAAVQSAVRDALNTAGAEATDARGPAFGALFDALIEEMGK